MHKINKKHQGPSLSSIKRIVSYYVKRLNYWIQRREYHEKLQINRNSDNNINKDNSKFNQVIGARYAETPDKEKLRWSKKKKKKKK